MELAMGTPNSTITSSGDIAKQALEDYVLRGITPDIATLCALGLDVKLLTKRHEAIKPQLPYLECDNLEDTCDYVREGTKTWKDLVDEAGLTGTKVLRFATGVARDKLLRPIFSLNPIDSGGYVEVEVFLARNGDWLIWNGGDWGKEKSSRFTRHETAEEVIKRLREIEGDEHEFFSSHYYELRYWSLPGHHPNKGRDDEDCPIALVLAKHIVALLQASISAKTSRLTNQTTLREKFDEVDKRNGLNI
jgi:hypothetical protein